MDGRSMSLESGRYMETIGWMSKFVIFNSRSFILRRMKAPSLIRKEAQRTSLSAGDTSIQIALLSRFVNSCLSVNVYELKFVQYHTQRNQLNFDTSSGKSIDTGLEKLSKKFDLSFQFGTAPHDFTISWYVSFRWARRRTSANKISADRHTHPTTPCCHCSLRMYVVSALAYLPTWPFLNQAIPIALAINNTRASIPNIMITNSGSQRFDVYAGPFTKNDQLTALPFADAFLYIADIPASIAKQVLPTLNKAGSNQRRELEEREQEMYGRGHVDTVYMRWLEEMDKRNDGIDSRAAQNLTLGYVTADVRLSPSPDLNPPHSISIF